MKSSFRTAVITILAIATPLFLGVTYLLDATNELALSVMITLFIGWQVAIHTPSDEGDNDLNQKR